VRNAAAGQILCEPCLSAWQNYQQPFAAPVSGPNPSTAAALGIIPGVGAMYNGQFLKGFIHVVIFAVLVSAAHVYRIFGLFIAAWVLYQSFEAFHTARAMRDGEPLPDPLGLNEVGNWLNFSGRPRYPGQPGVGPAGQNPGAAAPHAGSQGPATGAYQNPYQQVPYQTPVAPPADGYVDPAAPPGPPLYWQPLFCGRKEPIGAIVLIGLGLIFLLDQLDIFNGRLKDFIWPLALIALGVWLIVRRLGDSQGGTK
jgi:TM2 domain-containing membrane protein YozV